VTGFITCVEGFITRVIGFITCVTVLKKRFFVFITRVIFFITCIVSGSKSKIFVNSAGAKDFPPLHCGGGREILWRNAAHLLLANFRRLCFAPPTVVHLVPCGSKTFASGIIVVAVGNPHVNYSLSTINY
jgi:hypothetical protein